MNLDVTIRLSPSLEKLLFGDFVTNKQLLDAIHKEGHKLMTAFTDLKAEVEAYAADVDEALASIEQKIADAITADDAGEDIDLNALKDFVVAARARVKPPEPTE